MYKLLLIAIGVVSVLACNGLSSQLPSAPTTFLSEATPIVVPTGLPTPAKTETVTVAVVVDGDTIELTNGRRVRYIGINTPEHDQPYYAEALAANKQLVDGKTIQLEFDVETFDQYGRSLAYIWLDGLLVNLEIVRQGYASAFTVPPNLRYEAEFRQVEREAREAGRGLWAESKVALKIVHIEADAPGSDSDNPNGEWVEIANQGQEAVLMRGFTLKDEANHIYTFGDFAVTPGASFRLYSGRGQDSTTTLYWGYEEDSVWNNNSDTAYLRDAQGALVDIWSY